MKLALISSGYSGAGIFLDDAVGAVIMLAGRTAVPQLADYSQAVYQRVMNAISNQACEASF